MMPINNYSEDSRVAIEELTSSQLLPKLISGEVYVEETKINITSEAT